MLPPAARFYLTARVVHLWQVDPHGGTTLEENVLHVVGHERPSACLRRRVYIREWEWFTSGKWTHEWTSLRASALNIVGRVITSVVSDSGQVTSLINQDSTLLHSRVLLSRRMYLLMF